MAEAESTTETDYFDTSNEQESMRGIQDEGDSVGINGSVDTLTDVTKDTGEVKTAAAFNSKPDKEEEELLEEVEERLIMEKSEHEETPTPPPPGEKIDEKGETLEKEEEREKMEEKKEEEKLKVEEEEKKDMVKDKEEKQKVKENEEEKDKMEGKEEEKDKIEEKEKELTAVNKTDGRVSDKDAGGKTSTREPDEEKSTEREEEEKEGKAAETQETIEDENKDNEYDMEAKLTAANSEETSNNKQKDELKDTQEKKDDEDKNTDNVEMTDVSGTMVKTEDEIKREGTETGEGKEEPAAMELEEEATAAKAVVAEEETTAAVVVEGPENKKGVRKKRESAAQTPVVTKTPRKPGKTKSLATSSDDLPPGWKRSVIQRVSGASAGKFDVYIFSPLGKKLRSRKEVQMHCEQNNIVVDLSLFSFTFKAGQKVKQATPRAVQSPKTPKAAKTAGKGLKTGPGGKRKMGDRSEGKGQGPVRKKRKMGVEFEGKSKVNKTKKMEVKKKKSKKELPPTNTKATKKPTFPAPDVGGKLRVKFSFKKQQHRPSKVATRTRGGPPLKKSAR